MKVSLICIGSIKKPWIKEGCQEYYARILGGFDIEVLELPASKLKDPVKQANEESQRISDALSKRQGQVWALDELGKNFTSTELSSHISDLKDIGESLSLVIGGAYGLSDEVRAKADRLIALGKITLPHEIARLVLLEQLYRCVQIQRGTGYHHG